VTAKISKIVAFFVKSAGNGASAHFPKFVLHRCTHFHELRKVMGTRKLADSSAAFLFEVPGSNSPLVVQELQIGGTRAENSVKPQVSRKPPSTVTTLPVM
jgi:hypothetical protein